MPVSTMIECDDCGQVIEAVPGQAHQALYVNYSHPQFGGGGMYYCMDGDCAGRILKALPGAPAQEQLAALEAPVEPEQPVVEPAPAPEPAPSDQPA